MMTKARTANKVLPKAGVIGFGWTFVQGSTFELRLNFSANNPRLQQYPKRYAKPVGDSAKHLPLRFNQTENIKKISDTTKNTYI